MILDDIVEKRIEQLVREKAAVSFEEIKSQASGAAGAAGTAVAEVALSNKDTNSIDAATNRFYNAINSKATGSMAVIAEVKKASPSKGIIKEDFNPSGIAEAYQNAGANAISVLTEEHYFKGSSQYLKQIRQTVRIPILRKDFVIDEYQIYEAKAIGADAILLIVAILSKEKLQRFLTLAECLGLDCLVEVHDEEELETAVECGAKIIGINNRNLKTFKVTLETTINLAKLIPEGCIIVSESGIASNEDMKTLKSCGADAVLIGETLMRSGNIGDTLRSLRQGV